MYTYMHTYIGMKVRTNIPQGERLADILDDLHDILFGATA